MLPLIKLKVNGAFRGEVIANVYPACILLFGRNPITAGKFADNCTSVAAHAGNKLLEVVGVNDVVPMTIVDAVAALEREGVMGRTVTDLVSETLADTVGVPVK
jgi:hypothetical protein